MWTKQNQTEYLAHKEILYFISLLCFQWIQNSLAILNSQVVFNAAYYLFIFGLSGTSIYVNQTRDFWSTDYFTKINIALQ